MLACASCRAGNSPAASRRLASSRRYRRLGRPGSARDQPDMAALPSRPGSAYAGRERLAIHCVDVTGELAALSADPEAAGTTNVDATPFLSDFSWPFSGFFPGACGGLGRPEPTPRSQSVTLSVILVTIS